MAEVGDMILTISGPSDRATETVAALIELGLEARKTDSQYPHNPEESALAWIEIEAYPDGTQESEGFPQAVLSSVTDCIEPLGFTIRSHGIVIPQAGSQYWNHRILFPLVPSESMRVTETPSAEFLWEQIRFEARTRIDFEAATSGQGMPAASDVRDEFLAYIYQAEEYYKAGDATGGTSAALLYYYSFLNLAKAELVLARPEVLLDPSRTKEITHGISTSIKLSTIDQWELQVQRGGVFPMLYEKRMGKPWPANIKTLPVLDLFARCRESSMEFEQAELGPIQTSGVFHAIVTNGTLSWSMLLVDNYDILEQNPPTKELIDRRFRKLPFDFHRDLHQILSISPRFSLYRSQLLLARTGKYVKTSDTSVVANLSAEEWIPEVRDTLQPLLDWPQENDGTLSPGIDPNSLVGLPAGLARYAAMYVVSSFVRYRPAALDKDRFPLQSWYLETFTRQAALKGLESSVNYILQKPIIFTEGLRV